MTDRKTSKGKDYEVGYGKPPRHSQFLPGQSGFANRKHKKAEPHDQMISRIINEEVEVGGQKMTKLALAVYQAVNQAIRTGKMRDVQILFGMLEKYGVLNKGEPTHALRAEADKVLEKIWRSFHRENDLDPQVAADNLRAELEEAQIVLSCPHCGPTMRERWNSADYKARLKQDVKTPLYRAVADRHHSERTVKMWENISPDT